MLRVNLIKARATRFSMLSGIPDDQPLSFSKGGSRRSHEATASSSLAPAMRATWTT
uniref:Uncharacterized protein n=1 Tax=Hyaloperonospora arabidopsidis (strain Emoy2) TaxID=559515 RepID=M4BGS5_HYAAE